MTEQLTNEGNIREPVIIDPRVGSILEMASHFQAELDRFPVDVRRVKEMTHALNNAWPFHGEEVKVSGLVTSSVVNVDAEGIEDKEDTSEAVGVLMKDNGQPEHATYFVREVDFMSCGFDTRKEEFLVGGMPIGTHYILQYALKRAAHVALPDGMGLKPILMDSCSNLDEASIDFPQESLAFSALQACETFPEAFEEIDARLSEKATPAENILALRDIVVQTGPDNNPQAIGALERYVMDQSQIEKEAVPFVMSMQDDTAIFDAEVFDHCHQYVPERGSLYVFMDGIQLVPKVEISGEEGAEPQVSETELEFRVVFRNIASGTGRYSQALTVRVRDIGNTYCSSQDFHMRRSVGTQDE